MRESRVPDMSRRPFNWLVVPFVCLLAACAGGSDERHPYRAAGSDRPLDVPPDLTAPDTADALPMPELAPNRVALAGGQGGARLVRDGSLSWLEVEAPAERLWPQAQSFLQANGFEVALSAPELGILETTWQAPDADRGLLDRLRGGGGVALGVDRYRLRLERGEQPNITRVFVTHRGLRPAADGQERWVESGAAPEREAELRQRLLLYLGAAAETAAAAAADAPPPAELLEQDGVYLLRMQDAFARAWRRTGLALDRMGVIVAERDRSAGIFRVRLPESDVAAPEGRGWLAKLLADPQAPREFRIALQAREGGAQARVLDAEGHPVVPAFGQLILAELREHLN